MAWRPSSFLSTRGTTPRRFARILFCWILTSREWMAARFALIKGDQTLKTIPTVILTSSEAEADIVKSYQLQANCYLSKPVQLDEFQQLVAGISEFWLTMAKLPSQVRL